jgi:PAS domain S-box-containing protein
MNSGFLDKLIERIGRVRPEDMQSYLLRLADEKGFLETIFNAIYEGVIVTDLHGRINYLNRAACELFGLERDECMGQPLSERLKGLEWGRLVETGQVASRDMEVFYPQHRFLNFYVVPVSLEEPGRRPKIDHDEQVGYAVILRDITENRRATDETIQSEKLTALTLLAAGVAHELGNPLNSLHIHLQLMERKLRKAPEPLRKDLSKSLEVAREEIQRLDAIIQQFLGAIRPARLNLHPENINMLVAESVEFLQPEIRDRDIIVEQELRADLPLLEIDRNQIKQAFYNVIKNAFQAMKQDGLLRIRTDMEDMWVTITFTDSGGGISPRPHVENLRAVFQHQSERDRPRFANRAPDRPRARRRNRSRFRRRQGLTFTMRLPMQNRTARMLPAAASAE